MSGNLITDAQNRNFIYDGENKQKEVKDASNVSIGTYFYDGDGKRVKKVSAAETTLFAYDASGKLAAEYLLTESTPQTSTTSYLTSDTLGSPRVITDQSGNVQSRRDFMPFGEEIANLGNRTSTIGYQSDSTRQRFTAYERDTETDLDFAQARIYASKLGRFTASDPIFTSIDLNNPQSLHRYSYALNNPYMFIDPTGLKWMYQDSKDGKVRSFMWFEDDEKIPKGWEEYSGSNYFIGADQAIFLGAKGKYELVSREEGALGQLDEFLRGPESPLSQEDKAKLEREFVLGRVKSFHWENEFVASLAGGVLAGLGEAGIKGLTGLILRANANKVETALLSGMLREAVKGKGNFGIGNASASQADALGYAWAGEGAQWSSSGKALVSADGLRQYREMVH